MNRFCLYILILAVGFLTSCEYQPILDREIKYTTALIPVKLNWAKSGFTISQSGTSNKQSSASVHRATVRFFPKDGSAPFERYLEGNVFEGKIEVPIGEYSVIVMNESIHDPYWNGSETSGFESIGFENVDSYNNFSAQVKTHENNPNGFFFFDYVNNNHLFMQPPLRLSSWNLDHFEVTEEMVEYTQKTIYGIGTKTASLKSYDEDMYYALTRDSIGDTDGADMRRLTRDVKVVIKVKNLTSASTIKGGVTGFVNKVNMRTGLGFREPTDKTMVQYFSLNGRTNWTDENGVELGEGWQPTEGDNVYKDYTGETSSQFLSFGRNFDLEANSAADAKGLYGLDLDFAYLTGQLLDKETLFAIDQDGDPNTTGDLENVKLPIDVTQQVKANDNSHDVNLYSLDIEIYIYTIDLEYTQGDITVDDWGDDTIIDL